jgi:hypothetical protein
MMYGFGDAKEPLASTVKVLEEIAVEYMTEMVRRLFARTHSLMHAQLTAHERLARQSRSTVARAS